MRAAVVTAGMLAAAVAFAGLWTFANREPAPLAPDRIAVARSAGLPVLVEFGAGTCAACREMKDVLVELEAAHAGRLTVVDVEYGSPEGRAVQRGYGIIAIPTQLFFDAAGNDIGRHLGAISGADIAAILGLEAADAR